MRRSAAWPPTRAVLLVLLAAAPQAMGQAGGASARAQPSHPPLGIWYRSSEGCPDGSSFVARLAELGRPATLANVGDRVDFVVTLAALPDGSSGRLERQTERGTVAIRQLGAPACTDVAEALALSLDLALSPGQNASEAPPAAAPAVPSLTPPASGTPLPGSGDTPGAAAPGAAAPRSPASSTAGEPDVVDGMLGGPTRANEPAARWGVGARASLLTGLAPSITPGGALFVELGDPHAGLTARLSLAGAYTQSRARSTEIDVGLLSVRVDGCVPGLSASAVSLQPCAAVDVGVVQGGSDAPTARTDRGPWGSASALLRARLALWQALVPEAEVGLAIPFVRYAFGAPDAGDLYRSSALGVTLALGARWSP